MKIIDKINKIMENEQVCELVALCGTLFFGKRLIMHIHKDLKDI